MHWQCLRLFMMVFHLLPNDMQKLKLSTELCEPSKACILEGDIFRIPISSIFFFLIVWNSGSSIQLESTKVPNVMEYFPWVCIWNYLAEWFEATWTGVENNFNDVDLYSKLPDISMCIGSCIWIFLTPHPFIRRHSGQPVTQWHSERSCWG